jgi:histone-arginine methyltransferase CARM1
MMGDCVRTGTYQRAMQSNASDFIDKVVLDVGTGSGILAFFALQCGAKKVYAVDASDAVHIAEKLARSNGFSEDRMVIIKGKIEEVDLPERVDVIVSEPIGFLLVHERMLESYVAARDKFLKPGGLMMPASGSIIIAPLSDHALFKEQSDKVAFWDCGEFFGLDLRPMLDQAKEEFFSQAIVGKYTASLTSLTACRGC